MINFIENSNIFNIPSDIMINTVNCVGIMGKGIALEFKNRYPKMFLQYKKDCQNGKVKIGLLNIWKNENEWIINFPTKIHWKNPSEYKYIDLGLNSLKEYLLNESENLKINMPPLGCGNGGLNWNIVKDMITEKLKNSKQNINIFIPKII